jgi:hypothetical protein
LFAFDLIHLILAESYECRCAKNCNSLNVNHIKSTGVPIAKQGGSSCYPSACMNGGTCFSQYNPAVQTTTTTTASPMGQAICVSIILISLELSSNISNVHFSLF